MQTEPLIKQGIFLHVIPVLIIVSWIDKSKSVKKLWSGKGRTLWRVKVKNFQVTFFVSRD